MLKCNKTKISSRNCNIFEFFCISLCFHYSIILRKEISSNIFVSFKYQVLISSYMFFYRVDSKPALSFSHTEIERGTNR